MATMMSGGNASSPERYIDSVYLSLNEFSLQDSRGGSGVIGEAFGVLP